MSMQEGGVPQPIRIVFRPHHQSRNPKLMADGKWVVIPPVRPVAAGETVTWHAIGASSFELGLPGIFEDTSPTATQTNFGFEAVSRVRDSAAKNYYEYEAICNGVHAEGMSAPGVIVD